MKNFDDTRARSMPGVRKIVAIPAGVAVIADTFWQAKVARDALRVEWDEGKMANFNTCLLYTSTDATLRWALPAS